MYHTPDKMKRNNGFFYLSTPFHLQVVRGFQKFVLSAGTGSGGAGERYGNIHCLNVNFNLDLRETLKTTLLPPGWAPAGVVRGYEDFRFFAQCVIASCVQASYLFLPIGIGSSEVDESLEDLYCLRTLCHCALRASFFPFLARRNGL